MSSTLKPDIRQVVFDLIQSRSRRAREAVDAEVAAIIAVEDDDRFFPFTMRSLLDQDVLPSAIVVADCTGTTNHPVYSQFSVQVSSSPLGERQPASYIDVQIVRAAGAKSFADAVNKALQYARLSQNIQNLWLLHDDSRPADNSCLASLIEAKRNTPTASLLGAKQLDWSGDNLHNVGYYEGRQGLQSLVVDGESDQEQYDVRNDVFAVSLAGALVPLSTLEQMDGINPWFGSMGEAGDFSRRVCLSGGRVIVVPRARIAHRRARFEGVRSKTGEPVDEDAPLDTSMDRVKSQVRYAYTDVSRALWPLMWILHLVLSVVLAGRELFSKRPYMAWCVLCSPWYLVSVLPRCVRVRGAVSKAKVVPLSGLPALRADRHQMRQWSTRRNMFEHQQHVVLLSVLDRMHLRRRAIVRRSGACLMAMVAFVAVVIMQWDVFKSALSGASVYSSSLVPSAARFSDLFNAATTPWAYGVGVGASSPPAPWLLTWLMASVLTLGHTTAALSLIYFISAPVAALAFWLFAGIFTRSNSVRVALGLLWAALSGAMGLYSTANLPMLVVMMFMPAAFAFVFRAVGMYRTESPVHARPSTQMAACAALCFIPVVCAEPQLLLPFVIVFAVFICTVRSHRAMLLLIPIPAALAVAPTLVHAAHYAHLGLWRQLFADVVVGGSSPSVEPRSLNFVEVLLHAFGLEDQAVVLPHLWSNHPQIAVMTLLALVIMVFAIVCLALPFALRASRMMWIVAICGVTLALVAVRVAVAPASAGLAAGSALPGVALAMMAWMGCICIMAGGAAQRRVSLEAGVEIQLSNQNAQSMEPKSPSHRVAAKAARSVLVVVSLAAAALWAGAGVYTHANEVRATAGGLPMVAVDYLQQDRDHRILALRAQSGNSVDYTVMRTRRGDLMDVSPGWRTQQLMGLHNDTDAVLAKACAGLLTRSDDDAISAIANLGFGGIYVVNDTSSSIKAASQTLIGNVNASEGVQSLVKADGGTYFQLTDVAMTHRGISSEGRVRAERTPWRYAWGWSFAAALFLYCLVALPRVGRHDGEEA